MPLSSGHVFWIFGLSGAGKSTLAVLAAEQLRKQGVAVLLLDGDVLRRGLCRGLGYSDGERAENLRRAAEVARLGADSGICVIASFITPLESHRRMVRDIIGADTLSLIFADAPLSVCHQRDVKGLYARAHAGQVPQMTGVSSSFEQPASVELTIPTSTDLPATSATLLLELALKRLGSAK